MSHILKLCSPNLNPSVSFIFETSGSATANQKGNSETKRLPWIFITIPGFVDCLVIAINILCKASV